LSPHAQGPYPKTPAWGAGEILPGPTSWQLGRRMEVRRGEYQGENSRDDHLDARRVT